MRKVTIFLLFLIFIFCNHAYALCIKASEANMRKGPGTKYEKTWEVYKYMPFKKILKKGNWYKVKDVDGDIHWVYKSLVTDKYKCAVVKKEKINVRTGPDKTFRKNTLSPAQKYKSFKVIGRKGSWVKVLDEYDDTGWIYNTLLWVR